MRWTAHRHRGLLWALAFVAVVVVAARFALNPFVARHTQQVLDSLKGYRGSFKDVSISLWRLSYTIDGLKLVQVPTPPGASEKRPFFYAERIQIGLHWRNLIHNRELVGTTELDRPKLNLIAGVSRTANRRCSPPAARSRRPARCRSS
jgi:hypothetical protein